MTMNIGIDFGTSTTLIAIRNGEDQPSTVVIGRQGLQAWMPSVVADVPGKILVGEDAEEVKAPYLPIRSVKSALIGDSDEDELSRLYIEEILSEALKRARSAANLSDEARFFLGCPAEWDGGKRRVLADVVHSLGIEVDIAEVIDEPIAAGLAWVEEQWLEGGLRPRGKVLVFDAGGGTLDVALVEVHQQSAGNHKMAVLAAGSISRSGDAVDRLLAIHIASELKLLEIDGYDPTRDVNLLESSRKIKEGLSTDTLRTSTVITNHGEFTVSIARETLDNLMTNQLEISMSLVETQLRLSRLRSAPALSISDMNGLSEKDVFSIVDHVVLVGGLSKVPLFANSLSKAMPRAELHYVDRPQEMVVRGLTYGDQLQSLNLPRPPVNFSISSRERHEVLYRAFTPLYKPSDLVTRGDLLLRMPLPSFVEKEKCLLVCESPTRDKRILPFIVQVIHDKGKPANKWWDVNDEWNEVSIQNLPDELDTLALMDQRSDPEVDPDLEQYAGRISSQAKFLKTDHGISDASSTIFSGPSIVLKNATAEGALCLGVDGRVILMMRGGMQVSFRPMKMRVLFWSLKSR